MSRTPSGVRGLKFVAILSIIFLHLSHPVRGAWIEIPYVGIEDNVEGVAPRQGCVD